MNIHDNIKKLREEHNLTLEEVGKRVGTTKQTIKRYESGEISAIPYDRIIGLAKCFNVTPAYLLGWEKIEDNPNLDVALSNMDKRIKEYALKLNELPKEKQDQIISLIDMLK